MGELESRDYSALDRPEIVSAVFHPRPDLALAPSQDSQELFIPVEEGVALMARVHQGLPQGANILFFHGNGEIVSDYDQLGPIYSQMGMTFIPVDYRGYGQSSGSPTVSNMMGDSHTVFDFIRAWLQEKGHSGPLIIMGRSLGSAPALELAASRQKEFQALGHRLLDVNSQHSHQILLNNRNHMALYDAALPDPTPTKPSPAESLREAFEKWRNVDSACRAVQAQMDTINRQRQLLEYQAAEIDAATLQAGEKEQLIEERERLRFAEEIQTQLNAAYQRLEDESGGVAVQAAIAAGDIRKAAHRDGRLEELSEQAESLVILARDLAEMLERFRDEVEISPDRLNAVSERLHFLQQLEQKFQNNIDGIRQYREEIRAELDGCQSMKSELDGLTEQWWGCREAYIEAAAAMGRYRRTHRKALCRAIEKNMADLGMKMARFEVTFSDPWAGGPEQPGEMPEICRENGTDDAVFLLSANPGVPLKPLAGIASGGELSRIMLALKQHFRDTGTSGTLIFDEVDTGIGGDVANAVARHLKRLGRSVQIVCVTHLPQIAVLGDTHILVEKHADTDATMIQMRTLEGDERVREIARMLSGGKDDPVALNHAASLLGTK